MRHVFLLTIKSNNLLPISAMKGSANNIGDRVFRLICGTLRAIKEVNRPQLQKLNPGRTSRLRFTLRAG